MQPDMYVGTEQYNRAEYLENLVDIILTRCSDTLFNTFVFRTVGV